MKCNHKYKLTWKQAKAEWVCQRCGNILTLKKEPISDQSLIIGDIKND